MLAADTLWVDTLTDNPDLGLTLREARVAANDDELIIDRSAILRNSIVAHNSSVNDLEDITLTDVGAYELTTHIVVDSTADLVDGDYSAGELTLREALALAATAPGEETITFDGSVFTGGDASRIRLTQGELEITETLTIDGSMGTEIVISGDAAGDDSLVAGTLITDVAASAAANQLNDNTRVFNFSSPTGDLTLEGLTITGGRTTVYGVDGAGICFGSDGLPQRCIKF